MKTDPVISPAVLKFALVFLVAARRLEWTINASGGGRYLTYNARADGGGVRDISDGGVPIPPAAQDAQELNDCIAAPAGDSDEILSCLERFQ
jgi:hypothetical protein